MLTTSCVVYTDAQSILKKLHNKLFENYDKHARPAQYASDLLEVCTGMVFFFNLI